jgi:hypothetical protein
MAMTAFGAGARAAHSTQVCGSLLLWLLFRQ